MEVIMFRETLLESSPAPRKSKRWPMATAFTVELVVGAFLVVLPLLYSGVLPVSAQLSPPITSVQLERAQPNNNSHGGGGLHSSSPQPSIVSLDVQQHRGFCFTCTTSPSASDDAGPGPDLGVGG